MTKLLVPEGEDRWRVRLRDMLKACGLSYLELANKLHVSEKTVSRVFTGEAKTPGLDFVVQIVHAMGYTAQDLFACTDAVIGGKTLREYQEALDATQTALNSANAEIATLKNQLIDVTKANFELSNDLVILLKNQNK